MAVPIQCYGLQTKRGLKILLFQVTKPTETSTVFQCENGNVCTIGCK